MLNITLIWWQFALAENLPSPLEWANTLKPPSFCSARLGADTDEPLLLCWHWAHLHLFHIHPLLHTSYFWFSHSVCLSPSSTVFISFWLCVRSRMCVSFLHIPTLFHFLAACLQRFIINSSNFLMFLLLPAFTWPRCPYIFHLSLAPLHLHHF